MKVAGARDPQRERESDQGRSVSETCGEAEAEEVERGGRGSYGYDIARVIITYTLLCPVNPNYLELVSFLYNSHWKLHNLCRVKHFHLRQLSNYTK